MPPQPFIDLARVDTSKLVATREQIYQINPHRFEFMMLDGICLLNYEENVIAGYRDVKADEFWVRGHIPGRPIFPGVLMMETAAQLISYYMMKQDPGGFLGFGGIDGVKFRGAVVPGNRVIVLGRMLEVRGRRRCIGATQAFVDGQIVYEGTITGMWL
jgi:3-hydroxyacyl-[acyl-carrier-protein] dehydratase